MGAAVRLFCRDYKSALYWKKMGSSNRDGVRSRRTWMRLRPRRRRIKFLLNLTTNRQSHRQFPRQSAHRITRPSGQQRARRRRNRKRRKRQKKEKKNKKYTDHDKPDDEDEKERSSRRRSRSRSPEDRRKRRYSSD